MAGHVTTLWVKRPLSVNQHGQLSLPSLWGRLNEQYSINDGLRRWRPTAGWAACGRSMEPVCAGCGWWFEWLVGSVQWWERIRGVYTRYALCKSTSLSFFTIKVEVWWYLRNEGPPTSKDCLTGNARRKTTDWEFYGLFFYRTLLIC